MLRASAIDLASARDAALLDTGAVGAVTARPDRRITASNQAWLGHIVDGRYRVLEAIGRGGMGVVYKVEHVRMGKIAAMKVLHRDLENDPDVVQRFEREAAAVSRLQHPNAVQVFDFGTAQGALYLIMEYVRGQDLGTIVERDGPLPFARAAPLLVQTLGALAEAHELGIVHRDVKPDNVLVTRTTGGRDFAKVLDFGLAKLAHAGSAPEVSDRAQIVGTPYFMAPEQIRGDDVDLRADVYGMGALMYRILTGQYPFTASSAVGVLTKHLTAVAEAPSRRAPRLGIAPEIDAIVARAMAKDPADRWPNATAMAAAIEESYADLVGDRSTLTAASSSRKRRALTEDDEPLSELRLRRSDLDAYERSLRRGRWLVLGVALAAIAALAAVGVWWTVVREPPTRTREREPNDLIAQATRIALDTTVTGQLGRRRSRAEPDIDYYVVARAAGAAPALTVRLSGLPNIDVALTVRDRDGSVVASADEAGVGAGEAIYMRRVTGPVTIEVAEVMTAALPVENVSDDYTLEVRAEAGDPTWELEPNSGATDALAVAAGVAVHGRLEARADVDALRWAGGPGPVTIEVSAPPSLPLSWRGPDGVERAAGRATMTLAADDLVTLRRTDRDAVKGDQPGVDASWTVMMTPASATP